MSDAIDKKEKLMVELMIADIEVFSKCIRIMKPDYFEKPLNRVVEYIKEYFNEYHGIPEIDVIDADTGIELKKRKIEHDSIQYTLDEVETFCQEAAMQLAILEGADMVAEGKISTVSELVRDALLVKLDSSIGIELFENSYERIMSTSDDVDERSFGIPELDRMLNNVRRGEVGITYGTTGAGKSVMLGNMSYCMSKQSLSVLQISLELKEELYAKRMDTIFTGTDIKNHQENAEEISSFYEQHRGDYGDIVVKFLKPESTIEDIRGVVMDYVIQKGFNPDVIIVDYLGLMGVNIRSDNKFDQDEKKIFQLQNLATDYDCYLFTAGQLNRDGADIMEVTHRHVAGGLSAVNGSDWSIAMVASEEDLDNNQFQIKQLKIRNGARTMKPITLYRNPYSLRISDKPLSNVKSPIKSKPSSTGEKKSVSSLKARKNDDKMSAKDVDAGKGRTKLKRLLKKGI